MMTKEIYMTIEPSAFWSYVRQVDEHDGGKLSRIREILCIELQVQGLKNFKIFQDREDIKWGEQWRAKIENSLNATTFFIPVITPGFFDSTACTDELKIFLDREQQLGRNDLILPFYYINTPEISNQENELAKVIAARQWFDFRKYRHETPDSSEVRKLISQMASQIIEAVSRTPVKNSKVAKSQKVKNQFAGLKMDFEDAIASGKLRDAQIKLEKLKSVISEWRTDLLNFYPQEGLQPLQSIVRAINGLKDDLKAFETAWQVDREGFLKEGLEIFDSLNIFYDSLQEE
jgi:TIR domain